MTEVFGDVAERLLEVRNRIKAACDNSGRSVDEVELVAISKFQSVEAIRAAVKAGQYSFGENYAQEFVLKRSELADHLDLIWHFTGHLQANKAKSIVGQCTLIQSVDSAKIAGKIAGLATKSGIVQDILLEVNGGADPAKTGVELDDVPRLWDELAGTIGIRLRGLMTIAPSATRSVPGGSRSYFAQVRELFESLPQDNRNILSMGMSGDFEQAIAEGATMIRVGTAIFGSRALRQVS